jgi:hypothetical protein
MKRFIRRVLFFFAIAWRPATGPGRDEPPMTDWQVWWAYGISIKTAWEVAGIFHGRKS